MLSPKMEIVTSSNVFFVVVASTENDTLVLRQMIIIANAMLIALNEIFLITTITHLKITYHFIISLNRCTINRIYIQIICNLKIYNGNLA